MTNLAITVDEALLRRARTRALKQGTSVNALLRDYLQAYAKPDSQQQAVERFLTTARAAHGNSRSGGRTWTGEDLSHGSANPGVRIVNPFTSSR